MGRTTLQTYKKGANLMENRHTCSSIHLPVEKSGWERLGIFRIDKGKTGKEKNKRRVKYV
jgi:hypothetical protein